MPSRREFLADVASATAGVFFISCGLAGKAEVGPQQAERTASAPARREVVVGGRRVLTVDTHAHCLVMDGWDLVKNYDQAKAAMAQFSSPDGPKMLLPDVDYRLQQMDQQGIDVQAVSLSTPQLHYWAERDLAREIVRIQNEKLAAVCAAHPERLVALGNAALQHPDLAVEQMDYAVKKLGMRGFEIGGSVNGEELSSPRFHPFWQKAEDLGVLVFIHPAGFPEAARRLQGNGKLDNIVANPLETTVALSHLIFEGTLDRFPGVKICAAHGGGFLASYIGRSDHCAGFRFRLQTCGETPQRIFESALLRLDRLHSGGVAAFDRPGGSRPNRPWHGFPIRDGRL